MDKKVRTMKFTKRPLNSNQEAELWKSAQPGDMWIAGNRHHAGSSRTIMLLGRFDEDGEVGRHPVVLTKVKLLEVNAQGTSRIIERVADILSMTELLFRR
jgi:hypothetical protein